MALNQTQRKYAVDRLQSIHNIKAAALKNDFEANPNNVKRVVPYKNYPDNLEIFKAVAGLPSTAILKPNYKQLINTEIYSNTYNQGTVSNITTLVEYTNKVEVDATTAFNAAIEARYKTEVTDKQARLIAELTRTRDSIYLGEEEEALAAISAFNAFTV